MINFLCGTFAGILTGFGAGGGVFLILLLGWVTNFSQLELQSINLIYYIPTAVFSVWVYSREKNIDFKMGLKFIFIAIVSAVIGAVLANSIDINILSKLFAIYLIIIGAIFVVSKDFE